MVKTKALLKSIPRLRTARFRFLPAFTDDRFVNGVFAEFFPAEATEHQAAFAPLNVAQDDAVPKGVYWYEVAASSYGGAAVARADAPLVASWIKSRIDAGERLSC